MTTRSTPAVLLALAATLSACSGARRSAASAPTPAAAPPAAAAPSPLSAQTLEALEPLPPLPPLEPLACALHASYPDGSRPDLAAEDLACVVKYLGEARRYLAIGGKPTAHTSAKTLERWRKTALELDARVAAALKDKHASAAPPAPPTPAEPPAPKQGAVSRESEQHYLSGIIFFQKGDYAKAGDEWRLALAASPGNSDAKAGLERLRKLGVER